MKTRSMMFAMAAAALTFGGALVAADLEGVKCPVSGKAAQEAHAVDYNGGKVYFCCPNCPKAFKANTEKFASKANHQLAKTGQIKQTACPITGKPLNEETAIDIQGVEVAFCCNGCKGKVSKASPEEQLELAFGAKAKGWEAKK